MQMVKACADKDREQVIARSLNLGFLTGAAPSAHKPCRLITVRGTARMLPRCIICPLFRRLR